MNIYCTYITFYRGNKLPPFYIGSSSVKRVFSGYHGSVSSMKYKKIWLLELKNNPHLFVTKILTTHNDRKSALEKELQLQIQLKVVKNPMYINMSLAVAKGCVGMDVSGSLNPRYGTKQTDITKRKIYDKRHGVAMSNIARENVKASRNLPKNRILNSLRQTPNSRIKTVSQFNEIISSVLCDFNICNAHGWILEKYNIEYGIFILMLKLNNVSYKAHQQFSKVIKFTGPIFKNYDSIIEFVKTKIDLNNLPSLQQLYLDTKLNYGILVTILKNLNIKLPKGKTGYRIGTFTHPYKGSKFPTVCRLIDKKEMGLNHFTRWVNSLEETHLKSP